MFRVTGRGLLLAAGLGAAVVLVTWALLPALVDRLPGRVRHYLPEAAVALITTPLPAALPAPTVRAGDLQEAVAVLLPPTSAVTPVAVATAVDAPPAGAPEAAAEPPVATALPATAARALLPPQARIDGLPIVPQKFNNCGPTNLSIVLHSYGLADDQFDVAAVVRPNYEDRNVSPEELRDYVRARTGLEAEVFRGGTPDGLKRLLAAGLPVIVEKALEPDPETGWMGHYLTLYGYDDFSGNFLSRDTYLGPWEGDGRQDYAAFEKQWEPFNYTYLVVFPPDRGQQVAELLGPEAVEPGLQWASVAARARAAASGQPANAFAWFNLGSALVEQAKLSDDRHLWEGAAVAYDQARLLGLPPRMLWYQFGPYEAYLAVGRHDDVRALAEATLATQGGRNVEETYLHLGRALAALGDHAGASAAWRRVVELHPAGPAGRAAAELLAAGN
jgi:hypothetical protein